MEDIRKELIEYMEERGWDKPEPADIAKSVSIEAAEILEHFQWGNPTVAELRENPEKLHDLKMEAADVFIYLSQLAIALDFNLEDAFREKLDYVKKKYPVEKIRAGRDEYYKIKEAHRKTHDK